MAFEEGDTTPVDLPPDFVVPTPDKPARASRMGNFAAGSRKAAGDKADTPAPRARAVKKLPPVPNKKGQFKQPVEALYMGLGGFAMPFDPVCANALIVAAPKCAEYWDELAYTNESVRRFLWQLTTVSLTTKLLLAHMPIIIAVTMHHVPAAQHMMGRMGADMAEKIAQQMNAASGTEDHGTDGGQSPT